MSKKKNKYTSWAIKVDLNDGYIWVYANGIFEYYSISIDEIHNYLIDKVKASDDMRYVNFKKKEFKITGKKFMEVHNAQTLS